MKQLEMIFNAPNRCRRPLRSDQRRNRARWWFDQMRSVVHKAVDWQPIPPPRPEQIHLTLTSRN